MSIYMILSVKHITYFQNSKLLIFNTKIEEGQFWKSKPAWRHYQKSRESLFTSPFQTKSLPLPRIHLLRHSPLPRGPSPFQKTPTLFNERLGQIVLSMQTIFAVHPIPNGVLLVYTFSPKWRIISLFRNKVFGIK